MDNYTGPYWSDGKLQESVAFGSSKPLSDLDRASRLHDSAYARFKDERHRLAADSIYQESLRRIDGTTAKLLAGVPLYGNYTKNRVVGYGEAMASGLKFGGLPGAFGGLLVHGVKSMYQLHDQMLNGEKYKRAVREYYATDPLKETHQSYETELNQVHNNAPVSHGPITTEKYAPPQITQEDNKNHKSNMAKKTAPAPPVTPSAATRITSRPPRTRRLAAPSAAEVMLYLKHNPGKLVEVRAWFDKHPEFLNPSAQHKH